jgi:excisionase family DNA binding protein
MGFLRSSDVARMVGVTRQTIRRWCLEGVGPLHHITPGGRRIFREEHVREFMESLKDRGRERAEG